MTTPIEPLPRERASPDSVMILDAARRKIGMTPNFYRVMAHAPALLKGYAAFAEAMDGGILPKRLREQIALAVAARNGCDYCLSAHRVGGRFARLGAAEIAAAERGEASDPKEAAGLALALELLAKVGDADDLVVDRARATGFSDAELVELAGHVAINVLTNTINRFARTPNDFATTRMRVATEVLSRLGVGG